MKNGYSSRFLQNFVKQHIDYQDTVPELIEIKQNFQEKQSLTYSQSHAKQWLNESLNSPDPPGYLSNSQESYQKDSLTIQHYQERISQLQMKLQVKTQKIQSLLQKQDENETVIQNITAKNKQLNKKLGELNKTNNQLEMILSNIRLKDCLEKANNIELQKSPPKDPNSRLGQGLSNRVIKSQNKNIYDIYEKIQMYLKRAIEQFTNNIKSCQISKEVQIKIQEFLFELLAINSMTVEKLYKNSQSRIKRPSQSKSNVSRMALSQRINSPTLTKRSYLYTQYKNNSPEKDDMTAKRCQSFYTPFTERSRSKNKYNNYEQQGESVEFSEKQRKRRDRSQRRLKIFDNPTD